MPTVREIAEIAGVSASTVSRVLNGNVPVKDNARNKVLFAIRRLEAQALSNSSHSYERNVGIIMPAVSAANLSSHPSLYSSVLSFIKVLTAGNIGNTTIILEDDSLSNISEYRPMSAYLILGTNEEQDKQLLPFLNSKRVPFIFINRLAGNESVSSVRIDDEQATEIAVRHLIGLGHRKIAFAGGNPDYQNTKLRHSSFIRTLSANGIAPDPDYIVSGEYAEESGYKMGKQLFGLKNRPTAVCAASDTIAIGIIRYIKDIGYSVPEDLSVIGFGNIEASEYIFPHLTTISQNAYEMGEITAHALIMMMNNPAVLRQEILIKTELIVRDSCARIDF